jgi:hypothetical protein
MNKKIQLDLDSWVFHINKCGDRVYCLKTDSDQILECSGRTFSIVKSLLLGAELSTEEADYITQFPFISGSSINILNLEAIVEIHSDLSLIEQTKSESVVYASDLDFVKKYPYTMT